MLFRASSHSAVLELELVRRNIPYVKFGGLKFLEAAHVKDVLAFLRLIENPRDRVAGFRVLQLLPGVGPKTAARVLDAMAGSDPCAAIAAMHAAARRRGRVGRVRRSVPRTTAADRRAGRRNSNTFCAGTSRICNADTTTPTCAAPTCASSKRSPPATRRANASSPN